MKIIPRALERYFRKHGRTLRRPPRFRRWRPVLEPLETRCLLSTFTVSNTNDRGAGSLRQALLDANAHPGPDTIVFNIPTTDPGYNSTTGTYTIEPLSALPTITDPVVLDGYSQPGARANTLSTGDNAVLLIDLNGARASQQHQGVDGLRITAGNSTVQGLVINGFGGSGIVLTGSGATGNVVQGNFIGTDATGTEALGNLTAGVQILAGASSNTIGGNAAGARNIISANANLGVDISGRGTNNNWVAGNYIGTDVTGTVALTNGGGVVVHGGAQFNIIGTNGDGVNDAAERNLISGNGGATVPGTSGYTYANVDIYGVGTDHNVCTLRDNVLDQ